MDANIGEQERRYWVVSPNVNYNEKTVSAWGRASVLGRAAFMGWGPNHKRIGDKFAHKIASGDVILIARRHKFSAQLVGFGVVLDDYKTRIKGVEIPEGGSFGSLRNLAPFVDLTTETPSARIRFTKALSHSSALAQLHPDRNTDHHGVCQWMDMRLSKKRKGSSDKNQPGTGEPLGRSASSAQIAAPPTNYQFDFKIRTRQQVTTGKRSEARLLHRYRQWLKWQGRELPTFKCNKLQCDGFEEGRRNLIEAKAAASREHIRMAVGQLLDYAYHARKKLGRLNKAILLPEKPHEDLEEWLRNLEISLIWPDEQAFRDNAKEQFT
jgi:hypothetical protein